MWEAAGQKINVTLFLTVTVSVVSVLTEQCAAMLSLIYFSSFLRDDVCKEGVWLVLLVWCNQCLLLMCEDVGKV